MALIVKKFHFEYITVRILLTESSTANPGLAGLLELAQLNVDISHWNPCVLVNLVVILPNSSILYANLMLREEVYYNGLDHVSCEILS